MSTGSAPCPAGEGPGAEIPSPTGRVCAIADCHRTVIARDLCRPHYDALRTRRSQASRNGSSPKPELLPPVVVQCPNDLISVVAQLAENDARPVFRLLWRAIGDWHLLGLLEEEAS